MANSLVFPLIVLCSAIVYNVVGLLSTDQVVVRTLTWIDASIYIFSQALFCVSDNLTAMAQKIIKSGAATSRKSTEAKGISQGIAGESANSNSRKLDMEKS
ncbi:hypothetical protein O9G_000124 [Rozella allomycis CSF55]|uniref:Uncharacterized protein n=1 Tax=Rozella allomycis (strain CSF55) TaxID=988480 RepID=A0A075ANV5_ROZAC|nr:hypothetical protein O9G_000124 [Rozella allomycis CSF55]|eukprot:EPZ31645.1 hypothetical protein O9G_000124 [Rozella allomycis CSF55]